MRWVEFTERAPNAAEMDSDRILGYFIINGHDGKPISDFFGKLFWIEESQSWAVENFSNALRLTAPGAFEYEIVKPTHWCLVPELPIDF